MGMPAWERFPLVHGVVGSPGAKTRTVRTLDAAAASGCAFPEDIVLADSGLVSESGGATFFIGNCNQNEAVTVNQRVS